MSYSFACVLSVAAASPAGDARLGLGGEPGAASPAGAVAAALSPSGDTLSSSGPSTDASTSSAVRCWRVGATNDTGPESVLPRKIPTNTVALAPVDEVVNVITARV